MINRPQGWGDQYTINYLFRLTQRMTEEIGELKKEVARLEAEKANRKGRKPKVVDE